jgi:hypothetical protein
MRYLIIITLLFIFYCTVFSQQDSAGISLTEVDTSSIITKVDTIGNIKEPGLDSLRKEAPKIVTETEKRTGPPLIRRNYEFKSQVRLGVAMMIFIAIIFFTAQSLNP